VFFAQMFVFVCRPYCRSLNQRVMM